MTVPVLVYIKGSPCMYLYDSSCISSNNDSPYILLKATPVLVDITTVPVLIYITTAPVLVYMTAALLLIYITTVPVLVCIMTAPY